MGLVVYHNEGLIFDSLNVDHEKYKKSMTYYYDHTDQLEIIYEAILDTLTISMALFSFLNLLNLETNIFSNPSFSASEIR